MNKAGIGTAVVLLFMGWTAAHAGYTKPAVFEWHDRPVLEIPDRYGSAGSTPGMWSPVLPEGKGHPSPPLPDSRFSNLPIPNSRMVMADSLNDRRFAHEGSSYAMRSFPAGIRNVAGPCTSSRDVVGIYVNVSGVDGFLHTPDTALPAPTAIFLGGLGAVLVVWMRRIRMV